MSVDDLPATYLDGLDDAPEPVPAARRLIGALDHLRSARVAAHLAARADHVALHVVGGHRPLPLPQWRELAAFLPHPPAG
jgi:hypothetical protein